MADVTSKSEPKSDAMEQMYDHLCQVFGSGNSQQFFTLLMPGTTLNPADFAYTGPEKPARVARAESALAEAMFDITKIAAGSNGQRLSSQYLQALSTLVPTFDAMLPQVKNTLRDFITSPVAPGTMLDGKPFDGTIAQLYFILYKRWLEKKQAWDRLNLDQLDKLGPERHLVWYEETAEGELAALDAAYGEMLAVFAPADMKAILGALAAGPGGQIDEAQRLVEDLRLLAPDGGYVLPVNLTPSDWFVDLASDLDPRNLLKESEFVASTLAARRQALQGSLGQMQAMLDRLPAADAVRQAAAGFSKAQAGYTEAQNQLMRQGGRNLCTAVSMYMKLKENKDDPLDPNLLSDLKRRVDMAGGEPPPGTPVPQAFNDDALKAIASGLGALSTAQAQLVTEAQGLASAGLRQAQLEAAGVVGLAPLLARLQAQLKEVQQLEDQLARSLEQTTAAPPRELPSVLPDGAEGVVRGVVKDVGAKAGGVSPKAADVYGALRQSAAGNTELLKPLTAAADAVVESQKQRLDQELQLVVGNVAKTWVEKLKGLEDDPWATAIGTPIPDSDIADAAARARAQAVLDAKCKAVATQIGAAVAAAARRLVNDPVASRSDSSDRYMKIQMSFSASEMTRSSQSTAWSGTSNWHANLFFGSASGQKSESSALACENAFDTSTEIEIAFQCAKVGLDRPWLDPGLFKLLKGMSRLAAAPVTRPRPKAVAETQGRTPVEWPKPEIEAAGRGLLPCVPVAFLIAKDVTMRFKVSESSLASVHAVLESRSASGGGLFCFSASSASQSRSEGSGLHTRTDGNVISITIPGPQVLGWFMEMMPEDDSVPLAEAEQPGTLNVISFVRQLRRYGTAPATPVRALPTVPKAA